LPPNLESKMQKDFSSLLESYNRRDLQVKANPPVIYLESVRGCPYTCAMCHFRLTKPKRISKDLLGKLEPYFQDLEVLSIHGDGEPLLSDIDYFVKASMANNIVLHMNTTGFFLTPKVADQLLKTRLSIRFSIHSGKAETYKKIMGQDLNIILKNIDYLVKNADSSGNEHDFWFSFIVMKENIDEIEEFMRLANKIGVRNVRFMELHSNWKTMRGLKLQDRNFTFKFREQFNREIVAKFNRRLPRYQDLANKLGLNIRYGTMPSALGNNYNGKVIINNITNFLSGKNVFPLFRNKGSCLAPWFGQPIISQNGNVRLCCASPYSLGNLHQSSLAEIWNSPRMAKVRAPFQKGFMPLICGYCQGFSFENYPVNAFKGIRPTERQNLPDDLSAGLS
jgi:MoaA/NifB/PqqE/SkfB family radical SAM enzyme